MGATFTFVELCLPLPRHLLALRLPKNLPAAVLQLCNWKRAKFTHLYIPDRPTRRMCKCVNLALFPMLDLKAFEKVAEDLVFALPEMLVIGTTEECAHFVFAEAHIGKG